jgi:hypothetical protein
MEWQSRPELFDEEPCPLMEGLNQHHGVKARALQADIAT